MGICSSNIENLLPREQTPSVPEPRSDLPDVFSAQYTVSERVLSRTPDCEVRLCKKVSNQRLYVAKIVRRTSGTQPLESQILQKLHHPHIINLVGSFHDTRKNYMILEYLPNGDLSHFLTGINKLPEKTAADVMKQIMSALNYCHSNGVVHRDIKPENILIDHVSPKGIYCKLADFDSAGLLEKNGKGIYGTLYYTAPEVFGGKYDEKVDVWSCGVLLYQLLTGRHLFHGSNLEEIQEKINSEEIILDNSISSDARDLLEKMLTRDTVSRISAEEACRHPWIARLSGINSENISQELGCSVRSKLVNFYEDFIIENVLTRKEIKRLRNQFISLDTDFKGKIESNNRSLNDFNDNNTNSFDYLEFVRSSISAELKNDRNVLLSFFQELDVFERGSLNINDLRLLLDNEDSNEILKEFSGLTGTGNVNSVQFQEFFNYIIKLFN